MSGEIDFVPFKVTIAEGMRFWEDESTGVIIKRDQVVTITQRQMRSMELKLGLIRNRVLIVEGEVIFAFKGQRVKLQPGKHKNLVTIIQDADGNIVNIPMDKEMEYLKAKEPVEEKKEEPLIIERVIEEEIIPEELPEDFDSMKKGKLYKSKK